MNCRISSRRGAEQGFTLVELAIVMIIIGLLIGGILKGQELINNARISSTISQIKGIDAAMSGFRDKFDAVPGDMKNADTRLPGCTASPCFVAGTNGDGRIDYAFNGAPSGEGLAAFPQMAVADLISGVAPSPTAANGLTWGGDFPAASIGGGFHIGFSNGNAALPNEQGAVPANIRGGHYLALHSEAANGISAATSGVMDPQQAGRIDRKIDDGLADAGSVLAAGTANCIQTVDSRVVYNEDFAGLVCNLYIRIQQ
jgi:prepilin-type N-terminal cleavage/methylation domain-containing protein